ncbi:hypothetical protein D3C84_706600 [compost metagenome]
MEVGGIFRQLPVVLPGNREVVVGLGAGGNVDVAVATGLLDALLRPDAGVDIVGDAVFRQQIERNLGELLAGAALQKQHFIVGGNAEQIAQILFGLCRNGHVVIAAVAHLHHRQALAVPVEEFRLGALQNSFGKRGRAGAEIIGSLAHIHSRSNVGRLTTAGQPSNPTLP